MVSFRKLNLYAKENGIILIGYSFTEGFLLYVMYQGSKLICNRGVGSDTSIELLQKLQDTV
ncbi:hypothetical protein CHH54_03610 [Bacillus sp. 7520-S]|nr:hypothetical protein CHH54_03610 [Bacillus sp. 7520-S]